MKKKINMKKELEDFFITYNNVPWKERPRKAKNIDIILCTVTILFISFSTFLFVRIREQRIQSEISNKKIEQQIEQYYEENVKNQGRAN